MSFPGAAAADVLWDGAASKGMKVMKLPNAEDGATISVVQDAVHGPVFNFHKVVGSNRCEAHGVAGFQAREGQTVFIGWRSKLSMPSAGLTTNAVFQWKAYGADMQQNFPVVIKTLNGRLTLEHYAPGKVRTAVWSAPVALDRWNSMVLGIHVSRDGKAGYLRFWYNGQPQALTGGGDRYFGRTLDAEYVDPKWGIYGASQYDMTNQVGALRIGSDYPSAAPEGTGSWIPPFAPSKPAKAPGSVDAFGSGRFNGLFDARGRRFAGVEGLKALERIRFEAMTPAVVYPR